MKKIAVFSGNAKYKLGGAESCIATMVSLLEKHYEVVVISGDKGIYSNVPCYGYTNIKTIRFFHINFLNYFVNFVNYYKVYGFFRKNKYDLVIANCSTSIGAVNAVADKNCPVIYYIHEEFSLNIRPEYSTPVGLTNKVLRKIKRVVDYPFFKFHCYKNSQALNRANTVIANSKFIANRLALQEGIDAKVIYPFTPTINNPMFSHCDKKYISMVGSSIVKGVETFIEIARIMPEYQFLIVGRNYKEHTVGNVTYRPFYEDVEQLYKVSHLLLVPSIWQEAFGKVSIEAASHGIPVIVSSRGGLPETVPDNNLVITDYQNAAAWKLTIEKVLSDKSFWSEKCKEFSTQFDASIDAFNLLKIVEDIIYEK
ncbi:glycosyltransferase family 4 protein [Vibrio cholerae]|uniref:glycosyltransferase family 4 protein n=1 Tax=Vibrio cholerae TaxID=666 RepID=UPI0004E3BD24|nr:glycosyltransferase family 4 protein [Vibrio cholerae]EGQ9844162.1 glycosyltransferase family 4 protein [Vibrio cholerae]EGR1041682.1 glycosyltransferase [Vibrio cholerae]EGR1090924.1 glycosyltransferase [Vibrio cholerae]EKC3496036.1 glycosyltransferase family 4 protein [Vibrio cholerae]KFE22657.1 glycosyl transferases group 1 family protein [Vibrio cholerae]